MTEHEHEELVAENDQLIGQVFRYSLLAFAGIALVGIGIYFGFFREGEKEPPVASDLPVQAPTPEDRSVEAPAVTFVDITEAAGIDFVHTNGATGKKLLPETMGGGVAFFDYDRDGDADLFLVNGRPWADDASGPPAEPSRLYRNDGQGRFEDVTEQVGLGRHFVYGLGVAVGDYDGDGWLDLFVTAVGQNELWRNVEGRRFEEVTSAAGVAGDPRSWSSGAAFFDADGDQDLDLFVCQYIQWSPEIDEAVDYRLTGIGRAYGPPMNFQGTHSTLYLNDGGRFTDVSKAAGIEVVNAATDEPMGKALAVLPFDFDGDGDIDIFVANDTVRNFLFRNRGDGTFDEDGVALGVAYDNQGKATGAMGVDAGFYRHDHVGLAVGNFANEMTSFFVAPTTEPYFSDEAAVEGIGATSRSSLTFGLLLLDVDLDGRLDLLQTNGHLEDEINRVQPSQHYAQPAQLYWNTGRDRGACFVPFEEAGDLTRPIVGRGAAHADIDGDGDLDVILTQIAGPPLLLRNDQRLGHHWIRLELSQPGPNPFAYGAVVELVVGGQRQVRDVRPTRSYLSQVELPVTFGLGTHDAIDRIVITWPDGTRDERAGLPVDQLHRIERR